MERVGRERLGPDGSPVKDILGCRGQSNQRLMDGSKDNTGGLHLGRRQDHCQRAQLARR